MSDNYETSRSHRNGGGERRSARFENNEPSTSHRGGEGEQRSARFENNDPSSRHRSGEGQQRSSRIDNQFENNESSRRHRPTGTDGRNGASGAHEKSRAPQSSSPESRHAKEEARERSKSHRSESAERRLNQFASLPSTVEAYNRPLQKQRERQRARTRSRREKRSRVSTSFRPEVVEQEIRYDQSRPPRPHPMAEGVSNSVRPEVVAQEIHYDISHHQPRPPRPYPAEGGATFAAQSSRPPGAQLHAAQEHTPGPSTSRPFGRGRDQIRRQEEYLTGAIYGPGEGTSAESPSPNEGMQEIMRIEEGLIHFEEGEDRDGRFGFYHVLSPIIIKGRATDAESDLQPAPQNILASDIVSTCCRYSVFTDENLEDLDMYHKYAKNGGQKGVRTAYSESTESESEDDFDPRRDYWRVGALVTENHLEPNEFHKPSAFYSMATSWSILGYCMLAAVRKERNLIMNELFVDRELARAIEDRESIEHPKRHRGRSHSASNTQRPDHTAFVVVGWFPKELLEPLETCMLVQDDSAYFLPDLKKHITALRGWRSLLSFKTVQGFGLYECHPDEFHHEDHPTKPEDEVTLAKLFAATDKSYRRAHKLPSNSWLATSLVLEQKRQDSEIWAEWVHLNLNNSRHTPFGSTLALKLVIKWSQRRIIVAVALPLIASAAIGGWYTWAYDDAGSGWTIASYVVSVGAAIVGMLAVITTLKDGQAEPKKRVKISNASLV